MKRGGEVVRCCNELLHNPQSGISIERLNKGPRTYASQLARYIRNASKVRALTMSEWGRAPSLEECAALIAEAAAERERYRRESERLDPQDIDALDFVPSATEHAKRAQRAAMKIAAQVVELPTEPSPANDDHIPARPFLLNEIVEAIARTMKVTTADILGPCRSGQVIRARQVVCWVLSKRGQSYPQIGRRINRDHSTVISAVRRFETHATDRMRLVAEHFAGVNEVEAV